jgi:hypothetical protein
MWIEPKDSNEKLIDANAEFRDLKGELDPITCSKTLGKFLSKNLKIFAFLLTGFRMHPRQTVLMKLWFKTNFSMAVWGRGGAKSSLAGIFCVLYCILYPNTKIVIVSANFRSSRRILENIDKIAHSKKGALLLQCFNNPVMSKRPDQFSWTFLNGSSVTCVPLSNGDGLRGLRANVLLIDEALLVPQTIIDNVLKPFLAAGSNIDEKMRVSELEDKLIAKGLMTEEQRTKFKSTSKIILLSSASYQFEDLYKTYKEYLKHIELDTIEERETASYSLSQVSYEAIPKEIYDSAILKDIQSGNTPQSIIDKEYRAIFVQNSEGYFKAAKIYDCSIKDGIKPSIEIVGEKGESYILGVDPSFSSGAHSDFFAMTLLKIVQKGDKQIGMLVNTYAIAGGNLKDHILYFAYLLKNFNIVYIGIDASGGDNNEFINACNESETFKKLDLNLKDINADFNKEDHELILQQVRLNYNKEANCIIQKQYLSSSFQRSANEYLQACFDYGNFVFASSICSVTDEQDAKDNFAIKQLLDPQSGHEEFKEDGPLYFYEYQDTMKELCKKELIMIEIKTTALGTQSWDLPDTMRRSKNANRSRKDIYSALVLANWCLKTYVTMKNTSVDSWETTIAMF